MKLSDREWKDFAVPYVFQNIQRGKRLKKANHISGIVPYVSSTANNNGVDAYIEAIKGTRVFENCISLANSGSVGTAFYEPFAFVASDHVTSLKRENTSQYVYLFLTAVLEQQKSNFDFNREINDLRIKKMRIMLPVDDNDEPDYQFMEDYMKELMVAKRKQYQEYVEQRLAELDIDAKMSKWGGYNLDLESRDWKAVPLGNLFSMERGKAKKDTVKEGGQYPFVSAKISNNGVRMFVEKPGVLFPANTISLNSNGDGGTGFGYYQPYDYTIDVNTTALIPQNDKLTNQFCELFIVGCFGWLHNHFGNALPLSLKRAKKACIMLPVDDNDEPDYDFMEECGRKMMARKYMQYLKFLESSGMI